MGKDELPDQGFESCRIAFYMNRPRPSGHLDAKASHLMAYIYSGVGNGTSTLASFSGDRHGREKANPRSDSG
jgi:hypothetical protein